jgi:hypothetical protein
MEDITIQNSTCIDRILRKYLLQSTRDGKAMALHDARGGPASPFPAAHLI